MSSSFACKAVYFIYGVCYNSTKVMEYYNVYKI